ncbi:MAG: RAMP superfamily CRISPR-associated protein [Acidobacteria bacterium]|nr:RAMP superfamily CRISPR-associated protein [Acidobacteriota bacterium]
MNHSPTAPVDARRQRTTHRNLTARIIVKGKLVLIRPAHFGNGDADVATDLPLLLDEISERALIPGASLTGALRNYLREWQWGYELALPSRSKQGDFDHGAWNESEILAGILFGGHRGYKDGKQSPLIVDDAYSSPPSQIELRDGVAIDAETRTAADEKKFDYQLLPAGTEFALRFELLLDKYAELNQQRLWALALALQGLGAGEIRLGARKRRGFGCCEVRQWEVTRYQLDKPEELLVWLTADHPDWVKSTLKPNHGSDIAGLLGVSLDELKQVDDCRESFEIEAGFALDGSLLVRAGFDDQDRGPDTVHLQTRNPRTGKRQAVLPGTSAAGAIRQRAQRIANTLAGSDKKPREGVQAFINGMFGPHEIRSGEQARASRVLVNEEFVNGGQSLIQTRIKIDRFTQGTIEAALLEEAPHFGGKVNLKLKLNLIPNNQSEAEIGLLLLVLKDLWLGDLPLGGASSIGRGRLCGQTATLRWRALGKAPLAVRLAAQPDGSLAFDDAAAADKLEQCVTQLQQVQWAMLAAQTEEQQ